MGTTKKRLKVLDLSPIGSLLDSFEAPLTPPPQQPLITKRRLRRQPVEDNLSEILAKVRPRKSGLQVFKYKKSENEPPQPRASTPESKASCSNQHAVSTPFHPVTEDYLQWDMSRIDGKITPPPSEGVKSASSKSSKNEEPVQQQAGRQNSVRILSNITVQKRYSQRNPEMDSPALNLSVTDTPQVPLEVPNVPQARKLKRIKKAEKTAKIKKKLERSFTESSNVDMSVENFVKFYSEWKKKRHTFAQKKRAKASMRKTLDPFKIEDKTPSLDANVTPSFVDTDEEQANNPQHYSCGCQLNLQPVVVISPMRHVGVQSKLFIETVPTPSNVSNAIVTRPSALAQKTFRDASIQSNTFFGQDTTAPFAETLHKSVKNVAVQSESVTVVHNMSCQTSAKSSLCDPPETYSKLGRKSKNSDSGKSLLKESCSDNMRSLNDKPRDSIVTKVLPPPIDFIDFVEPPCEEETGKEEDIGSPLFEKVEEKVAAEGKMLLSTVLQNSQQNSPMDVLNPETSTTAKRKLRSSRIRAPMTLNNEDEKPTQLINRLQEEIDATLVLVEQEAVEVGLFPPEDVTSAEEPLTRGKKRDTIGILKELLNKAEQGCLTPTARAVLRFTRERTKPVDYVKKPSSLVAQTILFPKERNLAKETNAQTAELSPIHASVPDASPEFPIAEEHVTPEADVFAKPKPLPRRRKAAQETLRDAVQEAQPLSPKIRKLATNEPEVQRPIKPIPAPRRRRIIDEAEMGAEDCMQVGHEENDLSVQGQVEKVVEQQVVIPKASKRCLCKEDPKEPIESHKQVEGCSTHEDFMHATHEDFMHATHEDFMHATHEDFRHATHEDFMHATHEEYDSPVQGQVEKVVEQQVVITKTATNDSLKNCLRTKKREPEESIKPHKREECYSTHEDVMQATHEEYDLPVQGQVEKAVEQQVVIPKASKRRVRKKEEPKEPIEPPKEVESYPAHEDFMQATHEEYDSPVQGRVEKVVEQHEVIPKASKKNPTRRSCRINKEEPEEPTEQIEPPKIVDPTHEEYDLPVQRQVEMVVEQQPVTPISANKKTRNPLEVVEHIIPKKNNKKAKALTAIQEVAGPSKQDARVEKADKAKRKKKSKAIDNAILNKFYENQIREEPVVTQSRFGRILKSTVRTNMVYLLDTGRYIGAASKKEPAKERPRKKKKKKKKEEPMKTMEQIVPPEKVATVRTRRRRENSEVVEVELAPLPLEEEPLAQFQLSFVQTQSGQNISSDTLKSVFNSSMDCPRRSMPPGKGICTECKCPEARLVVRNICEFKLAMDTPDHSLSIGSRICDWQLNNLTVKPGHITERLRIDDRFLIGIVVKGEGILNYNCSELPLDVTANSTFLVGPGSIYAIRNACKKTSLIIFFMFSSVKA